jgi:hypothetical protein
MTTQPTPEPEPNLYNISSFSLRFVENANIRWHNKKRLYLVGYRRPVSDVIKLFFGTGGGEYKLNIFHGKPKASIV